MLSGVTNFARNESFKSFAHHIKGLEWFTVNKDGKGAIMTTGPGSAPTPPDFLMMSLAACVGNGVKFLLDKQGVKFTTLDIEVDGEFASKPQRRISDIVVAVKTDAKIDEDKLAEIVKQVEDKMCPVAGTLHVPPKITSKVVVSH
jgi:uncharacterized OsmC-like protein